MGAEVLAPLVVDLDLEVVAWCSRGRLVEGGPVARESIATRRIDPCSQLEVAGTKDVLPLEINGETI